MNYKISHPTNFVNCKINLPSSKSISNRLLIIKALTKDDFTIHNISKSEDTKVLQHALNSKKSVLDIGNAGTSLRFLLAYLSTKEDQNFVLSGSDRIKDRPIKELVNTLKILGANITSLNNDNRLPLKIKGKQIKGGKIEISGNISSQFITSILLIAPTLENGIQLKIKGDLVSKSYIEMTLKLMNIFGIKSTWKNKTIRISKQKYRVVNYHVESDWSAASFWFEIAALSQKCNIILYGLEKKSIQGDKKCVEIFKSLGVNTKFQNDKIILRKTQEFFPSKTYNLIDNPDLYQPLKCTLEANNIEARFLGIQTLKNKETDRILAVKNELKKINSTKIINTYNDHRMAMSFAPLVLKYGELQINNIQVVSKSYPNFWDDIQKAGFTISPLTD